MYSVATDCVGMICIQRKQGDKIMNVEIANKLVNLRKKSGLSQEELAEKIGVSRQAVSKWERAESSPDTDNLIALAKIYSISLDDMLNNTAKDGYSYTKNEEGSVNDGYSYSPNGEDDSRESDRYKMLKRVPIPIVAVVLYFLMGYIWGAWNIAWLVFLIVPIWGAIFYSKNIK